MERQSLLSVMEVEQMSSLYLKRQRSMVPRIFL